MPSGRPCATTSDVDWAARKSTGRTTDTRDRRDIPASLRFSCIEFCCNIVSDFFGFHKRFMRAQMNKRDRCGSGPEAMAVALRRPSPPWLRYPVIPTRLAPPLTLVAPANSALRRRRSPDCNSWIDRGACGNLAVLVRRPCTSGALPSDVSDGILAAKVNSPVRLQPTSVTEPWTSVRSGAADHLSHFLSQPHTTTPLPRIGRGVARSGGVRAEPYRSAMGTKVLSVGPTNSDWGRMRRLLATCSKTWAL